MSLWAFILYVLLLSWAGSCLIVGLSFSNLFLTFFWGSINTSAMPSWCSCHAIVWLVLAGPLLGLLYAFPLLNSSNPTLSLSFYSCYFGLPWPISSLLGFFCPIYSFRHPRPIPIPWASPAHSNSSFHGFLLIILGFSGPNYHILHFRGLWAFPPTLSYLVPSFGLIQPILACFPFLIMPMSLPLLSPGSFGPTYFLWGPFAIF